MEREKREREKGATLKIVCGIYKQLNFNNLVTNLDTKTITIRFGQY